MDIGIRLYRGPGDNGKGAAEGIQAAGEQQYQRSKQTPEEANQYSGSFDIGKFLQNYFQGQAGNTSEQQLQNQGALGKSLYDQTLAQSQNPDAYFQSTLQPDLTQAQDTINTYYQKRGLLNSGLAIESMGRAGVDLAIKDAQARMANRQQSLNNALQVSQYGSNMNQNNLSNLANLYSTQQTAGLNSLSRQSGSAQQAAQYQSYPYQAQLGQSYGNQAGIGMLGAGGGALVGGLLAAPTGGLSIPLGAAIGAGVGGGAATLTGGR